MATLGIAGFGKEGKKLWDAICQIPSHPHLTRIWRHNRHHNPHTQSFHRDYGYEPRVFVGEKSFSEFVKGLRYLIIATPPDQHLSLLKLAGEISNTVQIALEKPLADNYESARDLVLPQGTIGRVAMIYQLSYHPTFQSFCDCLQPSKIAKVEISMAKWDPSLRGIWLDLGPHVLDMLERMGIWPMETIYGGFNLPQDQRGHDQKAFIWLTVPNGPKVEICLSYLEENEARRGNFFKVFFASGETQILDFSQAWWKINGADNERADPRMLMLSDWFLGSQHCTRLPSALEHLRLIHAGYLSAEYGRKIDLFNEDF